MNETLKNRIVSAGFRRAILLALIGAVMMSLTVAYTVSSTNLGNRGLTLAYETFSDDADVVVASKRIFKQRSNAAAAGESAPGVEASSALPQVNNALQKNKWAYEFEVKEAAANSFQSGENFKIEVYMDDGTTNDLLATLYMKQDTVDDGNVEGVTVTVNTGEGKVVGDVFSIIITRQ